MLNTKNKNKAVIQIVMSNSENNAAKFENDNSKTMVFPELTGNAKIKITIPQSIILDKDCDSMRLAVYTYLFIRRGRDDIFYFSVNTMLDWMHKKINRHKGGINDKVVELLNYLKDQKYILYDSSVFEKKRMNKSGKIKKVNVWENFFDMRFNVDTIQKEIDNNSYTVLYWDEVLAIMNFKNIDKKDVYVNNTVILLTFAWIRLKIGRRLERIDEKKRTQDWIEAWECYYIDIANDLDISERMVSKCVSALKDLGLIYYERIPASKLSDTDYRSNHAIFVNQYKREGNLLLASGKDYYMNEMQKKKNTIQVRW